MLVSLPIVIWGFMPQRSIMQRVIVNSPALHNQTVVVEIDTPRLMRLGESSRLQVSITLDKKDSATNFGGGVPVSLETGPGATRSSTVLSRARFELARLPVTPTGELIEIFSHGAPSVFIWRLNAVELGEFPGRIWLYIQPQPAVQNNEDLKPSEPLTIRVVSILGLRLEFIKLIGVVGIALGVLLLGDVLLGLLVKARQRVR